MTLAIELEWQRYRYFPYERRLAVREVEALLGVEARPAKAGLQLTVSEVPRGLLDRLTYFRQIHVNGRPQLVPLQTRLEASATLGKNGNGVAGLFGQEAPVLPKQSTRYSAHGLHEYKGKFHPQIVRVVGNLLRLQEGAWVLDPFCGSGTCLLECAHAGWNAIGIDLNPLGVFISNTKLEAMKVQLGILQREVQQLVNRLLDRAFRLGFDKPFGPWAYRRLRPAEDIDLPNRAYLEQWFPSSVLAQLECIEGEVRRVGDALVRNIARVVLSDGLRAVSWQDPGDLRIRRRKDVPQNYPAIPSFIAALMQRTQAIVRARAVVRNVQGIHKALVGDARQGLPQSSCLKPAITKAFDCIITSPPYATALPYIDTQRLSLAFLGLLGPEDIRVTERTLIGNREITPAERDADERQIENTQDLLPEEVLHLCRLARQRATGSDNGFRRRNVPALLFRYFRDMRSVFSSMLPLVRPGGSFAFVVGPNRTTLGGKEIRIDSARLLGLVAEQVGWQLGETIPLDAYNRFDVHSKNSIRTEALVILRRRRLP